jgi:hypothetical protein
MRYSTNRSYRDYLMVEVDKVIKSLEEKPTKKSWWVSFKKMLLKFFKSIKNLFRLPL